MLIEDFGVILANKLGIIFHHWNRYEQDYETKWNVERLHRLFFKKKSEREPCGFSTAMWVFSD